MFIFEASNILLGYTNDVIIGKILEIGRWYSLKFEICRKLYNCPPTFFNKTNVRPTIYKSYIKNT